MRKEFKMESDVSNSVYSSPHVSEAPSFKLDDDQVSQGSPLSNFKKSGVLNKFPIKTGRTNDSNYNSSMG